MKATRLGQVNCRGVAVFVEEAPVDTLALEDVEEFKLLFGVQGQVADIGLSEVRALKRLLAEAERRLLLRQEQAARARNLHLDL